MSQAAAGQQTARGAEERHGLTVTSGRVTDRLAEASATTAHPSAAADPSASPSRLQRWREKRHNRVSKWDRPPDPHDWRYFVGGLGKILITTGLLMFGFVAYQLWGTGIQTTTPRTNSRVSSKRTGTNDQTSTTTATTTTRSRRP